MRSSEDQEEGPGDLSRLPRHVAIIMDGNGRWAKKRGLPRTAGHAAGAETFRTIATYCKDIGMDVSHGLRLLHGELEASGGGGLRHHGPAEEVSAGGHRRRWNGTGCRCALLRGFVAA